MPSAYLIPSEYDRYGVPDATVSDVENASTLVDGYLQRPEGLTWHADASGLPVYMAGMSATYALALPSAISAGVNVTISFPAASAGMADLLGEVFVIDRNDPAKCEAVTVSAVDREHGTLSFFRVARPHAQGATMEAGLQIVEERELPAKRSITRVSRSPIVRLLSGLGRYSYGRRSDQVSGLMNDASLLAAVQTFGGPPAWIPFDPATASISAATGEIWVPAGQLIAYYSEVRLRYVAGFPVNGVPEGVKQATASLIRINNNFDDIPGSFRTFTAGGTKIERFSDSVLDADTKARLEPYKLKLFF